MLDVIYGRVSGLLTILGVPAGDQVVDYSAYSSDENGDPVADNLDDVPVEGVFVIRASADDFYGGDNSKSFKVVVESPTWLGLCVIANQMILTTGDRHHCFLEGIRKTKRVVGGLPVYRLSMGS